MIGIDFGTYNLICARRSEKNEIKYKKEVNAFISIPLDDPYTYNMLKTSKVKLVKKGEIAYAVSEAAVSLAYAFNTSLRRPMKDGCLNPNEPEAYQILSAIVHGMIGEVGKDNTTVYYSVPGNSINKETDPEFHKQTLDLILKAYEVNGKKLDARPLNEALAVIFAELGEKNFTGISASFGAGQVNVCYAMFSRPAFTFSTVNSGDWLDNQAAKACGETPIVINREKTKIDLSKSPTSMVERAIQGQYRILIENTFRQIKENVLKLNAKFRSDDPVDFVLAGGTVSPPGFVEMVKEVVKEIDLPIPIGEIRRPDDHLYSVAKGLLIAAENAG